MCVSLENSTAMITLQVAPSEITFFICRTTYRRIIYTNAVTLGTSDKCCWTQRFSPTFKKGKINTWHHCHHKKVTKK